MCVQGVFKLQGYEYGLDDSHQQACIAKQAETPHLHKSVRLATSMLKTFTPNMFICS